MEIMCIVSSCEVWVVVNIMVIYSTVLVKFGAFPTERKCDMYVIWRDVV